MNFKSAVFSQVVATIMTASCIANANEQKNMFEFSTGNISQATCKMKVPLSNDELLQWTRNAHAEETVPVAKIGAASFKNEEPMWLLIYRQLLGRNDAKTKFEVVHEYNSLLKKQVSYATELKTSDESINMIPTKCTKVLCALKEIFGERQALQLSYLFVKYRFNGSHLRFKDSSALKVDELDDIILAMGDLPDFLTQVQYDEQMIKFIRGYTRGGYDESVIADTVRANAGISLFDSWTNMDSMNRHMTIVHEYGHVIAGKMDSIDYTDGWVKLSKWAKNKDNELKSVDANQFITNYSTTSPAEDFAESFTAYRYAPSELKKINPKKYEFMKNVVFRGLEYTKNNCTNIKNKKVTDRLNKLEMDTKITSDFKKNVIETCPANKSGVKCISQTYVDMLNKQRIEALKSINDIDPIEKRKIAIQTLGNLTPDLVQYALNTYTNALAEKLTTPFVDLLNHWSSAYQAIYGDVCESIENDSIITLANDRRKIPSEDYDRIKTQTSASKTLCETKIPKKLNTRLSLNPDEVRNQLNLILQDKMN